LTQTPGDFEKGYFLTDYPPAGGHAPGNTRAISNKSGDSAAIVREDYYYPYKTTIADQSFNNT